MTEGSVQANLASLYGTLAFYNIHIIIVVHCRCFHTVLYLSFFCAKVILVLSFSIFFFFLREIFFSVSDVMVLIYMYSNYFMVAY